MPDANFVFHKALLDTEFNVLPDLIQVESLCLRAGLGETDGSPKIWG
jgi:hypothetical protein